MAALQGSKPPAVPPLEGGCKPLLNGGTKSSASPHNNTTTTLKEEGISPPPVVGSPRPLANKGPCHHPMSPLNSTTMASANSEEKTSASRMNNNMSTSGMPPGGRLKFFKGMVVLQKIQNFLVLTPQK